jgi:hypothetical protein
MRTAIAESVFVWSKAAGEVIIYGTLLSFAAWIIVSVFFMEPIP